MAFTQKSSLKTQGRIHRKEKPFKCPGCDMVFAQNGNLKAHQRMHTKEMPQL